MSGRGAQQFGLILPVFDDIYDETAALALGALKLPFAITEGVGENLQCQASSEEFDALVSPAAEDATTFLQRVAGQQDDEPFPFPGNPRWSLTARRLGNGDLRLWQASQRPAETAHDLVADWVSSASMGDMGVFFFDPDRRLLAWNGGVSHYFPQTTGFPVPGATVEAQLQAILDCYAFDQIGDQRELWRQELTAVFYNPGHPSLGVTPGGRWALATATRMGDGSTLFFMNDVTEFRVRDQQLKLYMRNAHGVLFSRRELKPGGKLTVWGDLKALEKSKPVPSTSPEQTQGWYDLIDERDRDTYAAFMESRKPGDKPYSIEFRYHFPGSERTRWMRESGWTITDSRGQDFLDAIYHDITETRDAHRALTESEERFRQFAELASDWYFETNDEMHLTFLSERYEAISETSNDELLGRPYDEVIELRTQDLPDELSRPWHELLRIWREHRSFRDHQMRFRNEAGTYKTVSLSGEPRFDEDGRFVGYRGIGRDMSALANAQDRMFESLAQAEKANATKTSFIANVSHELRTPLNAILGFSSIMADEMIGEMANERYRRHAADIHQSGNHLLSLVNDLLDMSRVEAGKYAIEDEDIVISSEVERVFALLNHQAGDRKLDNKCEADGLILRADRRSIRQVLINLIANSIKFTSGQGNISVEMKDLAEDGIRLSVIDDGTGIPATEMEQIFEPFGRAATHLAAEGTGLGLPLSRNLIELHGGSISMKSEPGHGTRVNIELPNDRIVRVQSTQSATG